ncbi:MAG: protein kinase [Candidatus Riflebacteria bacterium]|nr:protein kinase [Candidatus Riflebacteria bacterium]
MTSVRGYRIIEEVASGSSGTVYRAVQESLDRTVALKLLAPGLFNVEETRRRFLREARIQAQLSHSNLVALFDAGFAGAAPYLATEFVTGGTLRDLLSTGGRLPLDRVMDLGRGIASGLEAAHQAGIVHRDLKPENVLLAAGGQPKVADFGLSKATSVDQTVQTAAGMLLGTPGYIAPEVIEGHSAGPVADVYALGVILFELLAGCRPFRGSDLNAVLQAQLVGRLEPLGEVLPGVPAELADLVAACLARLPRERPVAGTVEGLLGSPKLRAALAVNAPRPLPTLASTGSRRSRAATATVRKQMPPAAGQADPAGAGSGPAGTPVLLPSRCARAGPRAGIRGWWVLVAAMLAAGLSWWATGGRGSPAPPESSGAVAPTVATMAPAEQPLPEIVRVAAGVNRAKVWLSRPAPKGLRLAFRRDGVPEEQVVALPEGVTVNALSGLSPASRYRAGIVGASRAAECSWTTLELLPESPAVWIAKGDCSSPVIACLGEEVTLVWTENRRSPGARIFVRESSDGGATWGDPQVVSERADGATLCWTAHGVVVGWKSEDWTGAGLRFRPRQARAWLPATRAGWSDVTLGDPEEGHVDCLVRLDRQLQSDTGFLRLPVGPAGLGELPAAEQFLPPGDYLQLLKRCGDRRLAFLNGNERTPVLRATMATAPPRGRWSAPRDVTPRVQRVSRSRLAVAASVGRVVVAYDSDKHIYVQSSRDAGETYSKPLEVLPSDLIFEARAAPALAAGDGRFYLTFLLGKLKNPFAVALRSEDGQDWQQVGQSPVPKMFPAGVDSSATLSGNRLLAVVCGHERNGLALYDFDVSRRPPRPR